MDEFDLTIPKFLRRFPIPEPANDNENPSQAPQASDGQASDQARTKRKKPTQQSCGKDGSDPCQKNQA